MTGKEYKALLSLLNASQVGMARTLGINDVTSRRWARYGVHGPAEILLRLLMNHAELLDEVGRIRKGK